MSAGSSFRFIPMQTSMGRRPPPPRHSWCHSIFLISKSRLQLERSSNSLFLCPDSTGSIPQNKGGLLQHQQPHLSILCTTPLTLHLLFCSSCSWVWAHTLDFSSVLCCLRLCWRLSQLWYLSTWKHMTLKPLSLVSGFMGSWEMVISPTWLGW